MFSRKLQEFQRENPDVEFVLVGHNMGCMAGLGIPSMSNVPSFSKIVWMAPAARIQEIVGGVNRYLSAHAEARCHILTLHEKAEVAERAFGGFAPRGSLLVWIDDFLAERLTPLHHTSGRFTDALAASSLFRPEVADRVSIKAFPV